MGKVGVVIARFQGPELHEAHQDVLNMALKENKKILVILGNSHLTNTIKDPLDYLTRVRMVQGKYPDAIVTFLKNQETDELWASKIDSIISEHCPFDSPTLYFGRDSSINSYRDHKGKHSCKEVTSFHEISSTELREASAIVPIDDVGFRKGCIYTAYNKYPSVHPTVDIACLKDLDTNPQVALGKKHNSPYWRFPGGFFDVRKDESFEIAAKRELREEVGAIETSMWQYGGSCLIPDWRYDGVEDMFVITSFFICEYNFGVLKGDDDLPTVAWHNLNDLFDGKINLIKCHQELLEKLKVWFNERHIMAISSDKAKEFSKRNNYREHFDNIKLFDEETV